MALTGNLEVFPLQEVLRMLARSNKTGCLRISAGSAQGRVFIANGALTLAMTATDDELRRQIVAAGLVSEEDLRRLDVSGGTLLDVVSAEGGHADLTDFVREHVVESLYRIRKPGAGNFDFMVDVLPRYATGLTFDAEVAVSEAERRANEWADIESVIDDMGLPLIMARRLPDDNSVTLNPTTWEVLSSLGDGASVKTVSDRLGLSLFRAARELAGLVRNDLVEVRAGVTFSHPAPAPAAPWTEQAVAPEPTWLEPQPAPEPAPVWSETTQEAAPAGGQVEPLEAPALNDGWGSPSPWTQDQDSAWGSPQTEAPAPDWRAAESQVNGAEESAPEPVDDESRTGGWWAQAMGTPETGADDADAFLESVFSQLDEGDDQAGGSEETDETGFSMGLLRRRRMGSVSKDLTES
jgi:hypothetical protein